MAKENSNLSGQASGQASDKKGVSPDPKMRSFLRQAAAVISAERGLNDISTAKLQLIAERLQLPAAAFEEALRRLKTPAHDTQRLHHYEKAFVSRIEKDMSQLKSGILTIKMEQKLVELADSKYQITEIRAQQLIQSAATNIGVRTISHADAEHFAEQLIVDTLGDNTKLKTDDYDSFYKIGRKWGQQSDAVDRIVGNILSRNRAKKRRRWLARLTVLGFIGAIGYAGFYAFKYVDWERLMKPAVADSEPVKVVDAKFKLPNWLSREVRNEVAKKCEQDRLYERVAKDLFGTLTKRRGEKYLNRVKQKLNSDSPDKSQQAHWDLVRVLYFEEPNETNAAQLIAPLVDSITAVGLEKNGPEYQLSKRKIERAYRAAGMLSEIAFPEQQRSGEKYARRKSTAINAVLSTAQVESLDATTFGKQMTESIAIQHWNHELGLVFSDPGHAAELLDSIERFSKPHLQSETVDLYRSRAVRALIDSNESVWKTIRGSIERDIAATDEKQLSDWISRAGKIEDRDFKTFLLSRLVTQTGVRPATNSSFDMESALADFQFRTQPAAVRKTTKRYKEALAIVAQLERSLASISNDTVTSGQFNEEIPDLIARTAHATNLLLALENSVGNVNSAAARQFDQLLRNGLPSLLAARSSSNTGEEQVGRVLTAFETRTKKEAIEKLNGSAPNQISTRATALKSITELAARIDDLDYAEAAELAKYFLAEKKVDEWLTIEKSLPQFSRWATLKMAIADQMLDSNIGLDQAITLTTLVCNCENDFSLDSNWKVELADRLLTAALEGLSVNPGATADTSSWNELNTVLASTYQTRAKIIGHADAFVSTESKIYRPLVNAILESNLSTRRIENGLQLMLREDSNEIDGCTGVATILGEALAQDLDTSVGQFGPFTNSGGQLLAAEVTLMRIARKRVEQLISNLK